MQRTLTLSEEGWLEIVSSLSHRARAYTALAESYAQSGDTVDAERLHVRSRAIRELALIVQRELGVDADDGSTSSC